MGPLKSCFFAVIALFLTLTALGLWRNAILWGAVRILEGFANTVGRFAAWAGLLMVLQQIVIVFIQTDFPGGANHLRTWRRVQQGHQLVRRRAEILQRDDRVPLRRLHLCSGRACARGFDLFGRQLSHQADH